VFVFFWKEERKQIEEIKNECYSIHEKITKGTC